MPLPLFLAVADDGEVAEEEAEGRASRKRLWRNDAKLGDLARIDCSAAEEVEEEAEADSNDALPHRLD